MPFNGDPPIVTEPLAVLHADLCVWSQATCSKVEYMAVFTCSATGYTVLKLLTKKSQAYQEFVNVVVSLEKQTDLVEK